MAILNIFCQEKCQYQQKNKLKFTLKHILSRPRFVFNIILMPLFSIFLTCISIQETSQKIQSYYNALQFCSIGILQSRHRAQPYSSSHFLFWLFMCYKVTHSILHSCPSLQMGRVYRAPRQSCCPPILLITSLTKIFS